MSQPQESRHRVNGVELTIFEWPGEGRPVLFAHATGFHARCWDQVVANLPGRRCISIDMRGHGRSEKPDAPYHWHQFGNDVAALADALDLRGAIGVGHSMGGHSVTIAASMLPGRFAGLLLVDPVIMPREAYNRPPAEGEHFAARRRNEWDSPEAMFERFRGRPPYNTWQEQVLRDYCEWGLLPNPDGEGYVLACPPKVEAQIYSMAGGDDIYEQIESLNLPVAVLRARERQGEVASDMSGSPANPALAQHFHDAVDLPHPELTHFIPMEAPELVAREVMNLDERVNQRAR
ncbi:MAG: alpha/beta hydrolase [Dehalococcoidia bacterium]|nr:alpha/beta hydrolase [Dehalococcoidia bacterium]